MLKPFILLLVFIHFQCFSQLSFNLTGSASQLGNNCFELTPDKTWSYGTAWFSNTIDLNNDFIIDFDIYLGNKDSDGADGIALAFSPLSGLGGGAGVGIGYAGINPSVAIEFDTYYNSGNTDPSYDHIAIQKNGSAVHNSTNTLSGPVQASVTNTNIEDGNWHNVKAIWEYSSKTLSVYFDCSLRTSYSGDIVNTIFSGANIVYWGFTSATGSLSNIHQACFNQISFMDKLEDTTICKGNSVQLQTFEGISYSWIPSNGLNNSSIQNPIATPDSTTTYHVYIEDKCGNIQEDSITISVIQPLEIILADSGICIGESIQLTASLIGGDTSTLSSYWLNGLGSVNPFTITPSTTTTFGFTASDQCSSDTAYNSITVNALPVVSISSPSSICFGESAIVKAYGGVMYDWGNNITSDSLLLYPLSDTGLSVIATDANGCKDSTSVSIVVNLLPSISISGDSSICSGDSVLLTASGASYYLWDNASSNASIYVAPLNSTSYTVSGTNTNGCTSTATFALSLFSPTQATISGNSTICYGETATLTASGGISYLWGNGNSSDSIVVKAILDTSCSVLVTDLNGCNAIVSIDVIVNPLPQIVINGKTSICEGDNTVLTASGGLSYYWNNTTTTNQLSISPTADTSIQLIVSDINSCSDTLDTAITVNPLPDISISGNNTVCEGETVSLTANGGMVYSWCTGATSNMLSINPVSDTSYFVMATDANNCINSDTIAITVLPKPKILLDGNTGICFGNSTIINVSGGLTYVWGNGETSSNIELSPLSDTIISVIGTDSNNCSNSQSLTINILPLPEPNLGEDMELCFDETIILNPGEFESYSWQDQSTNADLKIIAAGQYSVLVQNEYGCEAHDEIFISPGKCSSIYVPNTFTPNSDGKNDYFNAIGENISFYHLTIFNRWGMPIFSTNQINQTPNCQSGWNGENARDDAYTWTVSFEGYKHGRKLSGKKTGVVNLLR